VIGTESTPDQRLGALARFAPRTVVRDDYTPPDGEVDLLISTDVLSEGQNLQQAEAVISYDMPWNPQRVVQRNGRVLRLRSEHDEVSLTTMLPEAGRARAAARGSRPACRSRPPARRR
jgi:superfamily II DNA/RNA helicase